MWKKKFIYCKENIVVCCLDCYFYFQNVVTKLWLVGHLWTFNLLFLSVDWLINFQISWFSQTVKRRARLPPGPPRLPLVGSLPFLGKDAKKSLRQMAQKWVRMFPVYCHCVSVPPLDTLPLQWMHHLDAPSSFNAPLIHPWMHPLWI